MESKTSTVECPPFQVNGFVKLWQTFCFDSLCSWWHKRQIIERRSCTENGKGCCEIHLSLSILCMASSLVILPLMLTIPPARHGTLLVSYEADKARFFLSGQDFCLLHVIGHHVLFLNCQSVALTVVLTFCIVVNVNVRLVDRSLQGLFRINWLNGIGPNACEGGNSCRHTIHV